MKAIILSTILLNLLLTTNTFSASKKGKKNKKPNSFCLSKILDLSTEVSMTQKREIEINKDKSSKIIDEYQLKPMTKSALIINQKYNKELKRYIRKYSITNGPKRKTALTQKTIKRLTPIILKSAEKGYQSCRRTYWKVRKQCGRKSLRGKDPTPCAQYIIKKSKFVKNFMRNYSFNNNYKKALKIEAKILKSIKEDNFKELITQIKERMNIRAQIVSPNALIANYIMRYNPPSKQFYKLFTGLVKNGVASEFATKTAIFEQAIKFKAHKYLTHLCQKLKRKLSMFDKMQIKNNAKLHDQDSLPIINKYLK